MIEVSLFHGSCATHWQYGLDCEGYETLRRDHQDLCRLCGRPDRYMGVDHDHSVANWAVRGILCPRCNAVHMRRVDAGEYPVDPVTRRYLLTPWYLTRRGRELAYDPLVKVRVSELSKTDLKELSRLEPRLRSAYSIAGEGPVFAHPGIAACITNGDMRPVLRLLWMWDRGWRDVCITEHPNDTRRYGPHLQLVT